MSQFDGEVNFDFRSVSLEDRVALEMLVTEYVWRIDHGFADHIPELFTEDGVFDSPLSPAPVVGMAALVEAWNERVRRSITTMHQIASCRFAMDGPNRATGTVGFILFVDAAGVTGPAEPKLVADHQDVYLKGADGTWRIQHRRVVVHFSSMGD